MNASRPARRPARLATAAGACLLALVGAAAGGGPSAAQRAEPGGEEASTSGRVDADAANPNGLRLACAWALADVDGDWSEGMTYVAEPFVGDASPNERPFADGCSGEPPTQSRLGTDAAMDVLPMPRAGQAAVYVELWALVELLSDPDDPAAPLELTWEIRRPDGSVAFPVAGARYRDCRGPGGMLDAAVATGQLSSEVAQPGTDRPDSFTERCARRTAHLFFVAVPIAANEPWGVWSAHAVATDAVATDELTFAFDVLPVLDVRVDSSSVAWPGIERSEAARVAGDADLATPERPTVVSEGNVGVGVEVEFERACLVGGAARCDVPSRRIDHFGAALQVGAQPRVVVGDAAGRPGDAVGDLGDSPLPSDVLIAFSKGGVLGRGQVLSAADRAGLDLARFASAEQEPGEYGGSVAVMAVPVLAQGGAATCPTDAGAPYEGSDDYNAYRPDPTLASVDHWRR